MRRLALAVALSGGLAGSALAHPAYNGPTSFTLEEQILAGQMIHGGFGTLIALGMRIGADALTRLDAGRRQVEVTYFDGVNAPCPCILDGLMISVSASPGQKTVHLGAHPAAAGLFAELLVRNLNTGQQVRYCLSERQVKPVLDLQSVREARARYDAVQALPVDSLFSRAPTPDQCPPAAQ